MLENLVTWNKFTFAVYVTLKILKSPVQTDAKLLANNSQHC